ncbi:unnamed protein product [Closterium sp. NIES-64]|nr:unnamed protein product [Closterium sp. NIES-64]
MALAGHARHGMTWPFASSRLLSSLAGLDFATVDPASLQASNSKIYNLVGGEWRGSERSALVIDPLNGKDMISVPDAQAHEIQPFVESLSSCPKSGLHNPFKNPSRYLLYGSVSAAAANALKKPEVSDFFARLIQRVSPKSLFQARAEVSVTQKFLENFSGDQVRFLARSFAIPGDHTGQTSSGHRWPYGPVTIISPFNFPLEIPMLQLMGALYMGNKPLLKVDSKVAVVMEQALRLLHACGMPHADVDYINCDGPVMHQLLLQAQPCVTQFTGSARIAEILAKDLRGKVKLEDAGFDWKILGPDVKELDYVAWVCDQDAYACSGQKCSAQSILFVHKNWVQAGLVDRLRSLAARRNLQDLTIGPVLTVTTEAFLSHVKALLSIPGARLEFGGKELQGGKHSIPSCYGAVEPTAVFVPLKAMLASRENFEIATKEVFGPIQVVTEYDDGEIDLVLEANERMTAHLTAAVVSNDPLFLQHVLANTVNGTTYVGLRARTTGAPQNHWFGPANDPRGAGIGTPEAIRLVWSCHREIISDYGPVPSGWTLPAST